MIRIRIEGIGRTQRFLISAQKQARFAAGVALTKTARRLEMRLKAKVAAELPSSTPYSRNSTFSTAARRDKLQAVVGIRDRKPGRGTAPAVLLKEHFAGGVRGNKPMEVALAALGALPSGWRAVPGSGMPLDGYGNPRRTAVAEMLGSLKSGMQQYKGRGKRMALTGYFAIRPGTRSHLPPGVYWRKGRALKAMMVFVKGAGYRKVIDLPEMARGVMAKEFAGHFRAAYRQAVRTAR
ncbi:MAG: hypothetical protein FD187_2363 [bacterium]|nr:MAG: hypothetical protein FD142_1006 [bacterium]KAF0147932.1 MAG: hypothetical protein FD187_2363 [bacterium]KAF0168114.1 MAG: hypothetical protein FD158_1662 [bacterium]TXT22573.1 MAG: hypothetical protein FD132_383 [bacterium]